jgi:hypothetical protein
MNRSTSRVLTAAVCVPVAALFAMAGPPAQASTPDGPMAYVVTRPVVTRPVVKEPLGQVTVGRVYRAAGGPHHATDGVVGRLPMDPRAVPGQPLMVVGTMKDALPAGLGDTTLPGSLDSGPPGPSGPPAGRGGWPGGPGGMFGGPSGIFGGLPGLGGVVPTATVHRWPVTPAHG